MAKALTIMSSCAVSIEAFGNDDCGGSTIVAITNATKTTKDLNLDGGKKNIKQKEDRDSGKTGV